MTWTSEAEQRLKEVPFFVRPAVRRRIEALAQEEGVEAIDEGFFERARARFGQK
ncbi:MAG: PCP reductase family protein [Cyanobium sp.]